MVLGTHAFRAGQEYVLYLQSASNAKKGTLMNNVYAYLSRSSLIIPWFSETYRTYSEATADFLQKTKKRQENDSGMFVKVLELLGMILPIIQTKLARGRSPSVKKKVTCGKKL
jgi:hypothetical protein